MVIGMEILLEVRDLSLGFKTRRKIEEVVSRVSFEIGKGEIVGIVGESGSGKSVTALSIMGLMNKSGVTLGGSILFEGKELTGLRKEAMRKLRGDQISMVFQDPMTSLNPVLTIGYQLDEMILLHEKMDKVEREKTILSMLEEVGLPNGEQLLSKYPHELSGGMRQRIMIAMAMLCNPKLLIADEPTTALDVTIQEKILKLLTRMNQNHGTTILFISHNLNVVKKICDRAIVMHDGKIEETGTVKEIFESPKHEYTKKLIDAATLVREEEDFSILEKKEILKVEDLQVFYEQKKQSLFEKKEKREVVKKVSFELKQGEILGIVGESGSGKSSLAKAVVGLQTFVKGSMKRNSERPQMVFQDPYSSLNPSKTIGWLLEEPLRFDKSISRNERKERAVQMLKEVGLPANYMNRYPSDLSGGQRQRVAIAMAIMLNQDLIVLDEPVSALDVTVQAQILKLLLRLRRQHHLSYLFISHDMGVIYRMCDRVLVMYDGNIVEAGDTKEVFEHPKHEYTKKLLKAIP